MGFYDRFIKWFVVDETLLPPLEWLAAGEHFIPIYFSDLLEKALAEERLNESERAQLRTLAEMFAEHYHLDYHKSALALKDAFAPFDPDAEVSWTPNYSDDYREACRKKFMDGIQQFLTACNFCELEPQKLNAILEAPYPGVLPIAVDRRKLDFFKIYYRGTTETTYSVSVFGILKKTYPSKKLKRVFVLARYSEKFNHQIIAKVFRDVAVENLKVVIPEVRLTLPIFDKIKVSGTGLVAVTTALLKVFLASALTLAGFLVVLAGVIGGFLKAIFGFLNSRTKCLKTYSESLYHQSLAGNMGAVNLLVEQAETQEVKEAFLAYFILYVLRYENLSQDALDQKVEGWIQKTFGFCVDFEVEDALRKLVEKKLVERLESDGTEPYFKVYDLPSALRRLDEMWDDYHQESNEGDPANDRLAC